MHLQEEENVAIHCSTLLGGGKITLHYKTHIHSLSSLHCHPLDDVIVMFDRTAEKIDNIFSDHSSVIIYISGDFSIHNILYLPLLKQHDKLKRKALVFFFKIKL